MKLSSSTISSIETVHAGALHRLPAALIIAAALFAGPALTNAQNPHKPTAKTLKPHPRINEETASQPSGTATISTTSPTITPLIVGPAWTAIGPAPIPNGQTVPADANGISLTQAPVSGRLTAV